MSQSTKINEGLLAELRARRSSGEPIKKLADEIGWTWQKLDKSIRNGMAKHTASGSEIRLVRSSVAEVDWSARSVKVETTRDTSAGRLVEKYRPTSIIALCGQPRAVTKLNTFIKSPYPTSFLFYGETGTGKTSAALALAKELGCDMSNKGLGGLFVVASGEQSADAVRELFRSLMFAPLNKTGWKVVVVNEADRMHPQAETIWLDRLESLPKKTVVIFTTNYYQKMTPRFRDRSEKVPFSSAISDTLPAAKGLVKAIWEAETGSEPTEEEVQSIVKKCAEGGSLSFRRVVQETAETLSEHV